MKLLQEFVNLKETGFRIFHHFGTTILRTKVIFHKFDLSVDFSFEICWPLVTLKKWKFYIFHSPKKLSKMFFFCNFISLNVEFRLVYDLTVASLFS